MHRIREAFEDEAYWRARLGAFDVGGPTLDYLTTDVGGGTSVSMTMRFGREQLPPVMQRLRLPSLEVVQRERWFAIGEDEMRGDITVDARRTPISGTGTVSVAPQGGGSRLDGSASVEVNVPIIGGPIRTFVQGLLTQGILDIVRVTDAWLAENP